MSDYANPDVLVSTGWVAEHLNDPKVKLVEVDVDTTSYDKGHVKGALGWNWQTQLCDSVRRDVVDPKKFAELCSNASIKPDDTVVFYGDNNNWFAAWAFWQFKMNGHKDVRLMNGGRKKWELEKRELSTEAAKVNKSSYPAPKSDESIRAFRREVEDIVGKGKSNLVDVRSPEEFSGKVIAPAGIQELAIRAGHVPGAKNIPWKKAVNDDGTFKSVDELRKLYAEAGIDGKSPVITYCRIGERSSHSWFVLKFLLGYDVRNYDGSWTEYGNSVGVPIVNEAGTVWTGK